MSISQVLLFCASNFHMSWSTCSLAFDSIHVLHASGMKPLQVTHQESAEYM